MGKGIRENKRENKSVWKSNILDIQHVGSTAINYICAKPILDIAIRLKSIEDMNIEAMQKLGYEFCGSRNKEKTYFLFVLRDKNEYSLHHIHCYSKDEKEYFKLIGFRDYLNENRSYAKQYSDLKENLAQKYSDNRELYTNGKEEFIKMVYSKLNL